jgi:aminopeptidase B
MVQSEDDNTRRGEDLDFHVEPFTGFGSALHIDTSAGVHELSDFFVITIDYSTGNQGPAICWLNPEQTAGKKHPYLFTQGQACLNRSLFPCQDTPSIKVCMSAELVVPKPLVAVCSAEMHVSISVFGLISTQEESRGACVGDAESH